MFQIQTINSIVSTHKTRQEALEALSKIPGSGAVIREVSAPLKGNPSLEFIEEWSDRISKEFVEFEKKLKEVFIGRTIMYCPPDEKEQGPEEITAVVLDVYNEQPLCGDRHKMSKLLDLSLFYGEKDDHMLVMLENIRYIKFLD